MSAADAALAGLRDLIAAMVREQVAAALAQRPEPRPAPTLPRTLTVPECVRTYGIGRQQILAMIESGRLPAISAKMRGGRQGWRIAREDAERVLAGAGIENRA